MEQFCGCWMAYPRCKEDCYWYEEWQDMGAQVPYCRCKRAGFIEPKDCENCKQYHSKYKPTKADRIRAMTDEELADWYFNEFFRKVPYCRKEECYEDAPCEECLLDWLKQEAE